MNKIYIYILFFFAFVGFITFLILLYKLINTLVKFLKELEFVNILNNKIDNFLSRYFKTIMFMFGIIFIIAGCAELFENKNDALTDYCTIFSLGLSLISIGITLEIKAKVKE